MAAAYCVVSKPHSETLSMGIKDFNSRLALLSDAFSIFEADKATNGSSNLVIAIMWSISLEGI